MKSRAYAAACGRRQRLQRGYQMIDRQAGTEPFQHADKVRQTRAPKRRLINSPLALRFSHRGRQVELQAVVLARLAGEPRAQLVEEAGSA